MSDAFGDLALSIDPQLAREVLEKLKIAIPEEGRSATLESIGSLTSRDLLFYSIGKTTGMAMATTSFYSAFFAGVPEQEEKGGNYAKRE